VPLLSTANSAQVCSNQFNGLGYERPIGGFRLDLIVEPAVVLELKSVGRMDPVFDAQLLTYLRLTGIKKGLLINFNSRLFKDGIKRLVL